MARTPRSLDRKKGEAILASAITLFLAKGYEATTMDAVAKHAGVTKQTVYSHHKNKEQLFVHIVRHLCNERVGGAAIHGQQQRPFEELLFDIGINLLSLITTEVGIAVTRLVVADAGKHPELTRLYYDNGTRRVVELIALFLDGQRARGMHCIKDTRSAAAYFFALLKGEYFLRKALGVPPMPTKRALKAHVQEVVVIFMRLYGGGNPLHTVSKV